MTRPITRVFMSAGHDDECRRLQSMLPGLSRWLSLWFLIMAGVFCDNYLRCYFPHPLTGFVGIRLGCGDLQPRALLKGANRVGEADRTELVQFQQNPGNLGKEACPLASGGGDEMEMETEMEMGLRLPSAATLPPLAMSPFPYLPCPVLCSVLAANCTHEHVEKLIHRGLHLSDRPFTSSSSLPQASLSSSRCCCCCVASPVMILVAPSVAPHPTQQIAGRTAILAQHHGRSITYRRFLRKPHIAASGPNTTWYFHSFTHSLHYRCISADLDLCTNGNPENSLAEYILHNRACANLHL